MPEQHDAAVVARITAAMGASGTPVFDSTVVGKPEKYVLVYGNRGVARADRLTGPAYRRRLTYWIHSVGANKRQASAVAEVVLTQLVNWTPAVTGWSCEQITHAASEPVALDDTIKDAQGRPIFTGIDQFDLYTTPDSSTTGGS